MPFIQAVLMEIHRWKTSAPFGGFRTALTATKIGGYDIPPGRTVVTNIWAIHHDPEVWDSPDVFNPWRFLSEDGKQVRKEQVARMMPFTAGKRMCPGEPLANVTGFLYFVSVMQRYRVVSDGPVNYEEDFAIDAFPRYPTILRFIKR